jgi:hypothetical protein
MLVDERQMTVKVLDPKGRQALKTGKMEKLWLWRDEGDGGLCGVMWAGSTDYAKG